MKYKINDHVIHKNEGLCVVNDIVVMAGREYYKMNVINKSENTTIYLPISKEDEMLMELMTKNEADTLLDYMKSLKEEIVESSKERRNEFTKLLSSGDKKDLAYIIKYLYLLKKDKDKRNVKLGEQDTNTYNKACDLLYDELAIVYDISRDKVEEFIANRMES